MSKLFSNLPLAALALALPAAVQAQDYRDLPPLAPMAEAEMRTLPADMRAAPAAVMAAPQLGETVTMVNGVETITRTRMIDAPRQVMPQPAVPAHGYAPQYAPQPMAYSPAVFQRDQWIDECRRRTRGQNRDNTGTIIGGLLGAIAGGFGGYEIAGAGDRVLGTVLGVGGGGLIGGLLGSLFDRDDDDQYDCEAALDAYLSQYGAPGGRMASRQIAAPYPGGPAYGYGYPATYSYGYTYATPPQIVMVEVETLVEQQVVVRETERYETIPGAAREIPQRRPSPKMIKLQKR